VSKAPLVGFLELLRKRDDTLKRIDNEFVTREKKVGRRYITTRNDFMTQFKELNKKLNAPKMRCSEQHAYEAKWLISYSDHWDAVADALDVYDKSLEDTDQPDLAQDLDGSWGRCYAKWYRKLEPTVDALQEERFKCSQAKRLAFMDPLKDIDAALRELNDLKVSRIAETGWNTRDEYGARLTALSQLAFKSKVKTVLDGCDALGFALKPDYIDKYRVYLWREQHESGYWGPTYVFDGKETPIQDLSFTFHVVHYYTQDKDKTEPLPNLDRIARTTLEIKDLTYPNGWRTRTGGLEDHHNYDVAILFARSWGAAGPELQKKIAPEIQKLVNWCVTESLNGEQFGTGTPDVWSYYYGVRFLDEVGLWDEEQRFWHKGPVPLPPGFKADKIRGDLQRGFDRIDDHSEPAETIRAILWPKP
jgi:hypothetical protein